MALTNISIENNKLKSSLGIGTGQFSTYFKIHDVKFNQDRNESTVLLLAYSSKTAYENGASHTDSKAYEWNNRRANDPQFPFTEEALRPANVTPVTIAELKIKAIDPLFADAIIE